MGHRHFPNSSNKLGNNQDHDNNSQSQQSYHLSGGLAVSENGSFVSPLINFSRDGVHWDHQRNPEDRLNEYASSSFYSEVRSLPPPPFSGNSYYPYSDSVAAGNMYMLPHPHPDTNAFQINSSYYNRQAIHHFEGVIRGSERGSYKRKHPGDPSFYGPFERGSTSRSCGAGSSSGSSQLPIEKPASDYQGISLGPLGLRQHRDSGLSVFGEDSLRNVRSRSRLDVEPASARTHFSSYPSQHYNSATFRTYPPGRVNLASSNADQARHEWNHRPFSSSAVVPGRGSIAVNNGVSPTMNQFIVGGSASNVSGGHHGYISSGHPVSSSQYFNSTSTQVARESGNVHSRRSISTYMNGLSNSSLGHEAITPDVMHSHVGSSNFRYTGPLSAGGLHDSYRNVRSSLALERLQPISGLVDARPRIGTEVSMIVDHASFYSASRSSFDQYSDMRLDVDSMSYEELLALVENIGNVSTGLSEDMISKCLSRKKYSSGNQNCVEGFCAICLEEYKTEDGIGTLKNCGHDYHVDCITKWLSVKNVCPICKATALTESSN